MPGKPAPGIFANVSIYAVFRNCNLQIMLIYVKIYVGDTITVGGLVSTFKALLNGLLKEVGTMVDYSGLFQFVIMLCAVITLVTRNNKPKK